MGIDDDDERILAALIRAQGNVERALAILLED